MKLNQTSKSYHDDNNGDSRVKNCILIFVNYVFIKLSPTTSGVYRRVCCSVSRNHASRIITAAAGIGNRVIILIISILICEFCTFAKRIPVSKIVYATAIVLRHKKWSKRLFLWIYLRHLKKLPHFHLFTKS